MSLIEYLKIVELTELTEKSERELYFIRNHPWRFLLRSMFSPIIKYKKKLKNYFYRRDIEGRTVAQPVTGRFESNKIVSILKLNEYNSIYKGQIDYKITEELNDKIVFNSDNDKILFVHAYYIEEAKYLIEKIKRFHNYDIMVSTPDYQIANLFEKELDNEQVNIIVLPNHGRDIFPFLLMVKHVDINKYRHFIKLHTKRSQHLNDNGMWFRSNVNVLVGQNNISDRLCSLIDPESCTIVGIDKLPIQDHHENNRYWLPHLIGKKLDVVEADFIPGTMFIGTWKFLDVLDRLNLHLYKMEEENRQLDGCCIHAIERYFGYLTKEHNGECLTVKELADREKFV